MVPVVWSTAGRESQRNNSWIGNSNESEQGTLGKRRLHAHRGQHARERRSAGRPGLASPRACKVLDLGCGDGTTAIPAAKLGARRAGRRYRQQPGRGRQRARPASWAWRTAGFRKATPPTCTSWSDDSFDLVVSIFGAMFAPRPFDVAREMVRVTRPGGRIVMGNWIPGDPTLVAQILKISSAYSPPPPEGFVSPMTWGVESQCDRAVWRRGRARRRTSPSSGTRTRFNYPGTARGARWTRSGPITGRP